MSKFFKLSAIALAIGGCALMSAPPASAATVVSLLSAGSSGSIGNAFFQQVDDQSTGTGVIDPFLRLQANGSESGINSPGPYLLDEKTGIWTHSVRVSDFGVVDRGGVASIRFLLDINQTNANPLISLDGLKVFTAGTGSYNSLSLLGSNGTLIYDMDAGDAGNKVLMDYSLNAGSGSGDVLAYLPVNLFAGHENDYLYLYSDFGSSGGDYATNDGFEEWARIDGATPPTTVPEPTTLLLLGGGLVGGVLARRRRNAA